MSSSTLTLGLLGAAATAAIIYVYVTSKPPKGRKRENGLCGLYNLGNTCYANALIQGLSSLPSMVSWLRKLQCDGDETRFVRELRKIIIDLDAVTGETLSAYEVSAALISRGWSINLGMEQDLHELMTVFEATWDEELAEARARRLHGGLLQVRELSEGSGERATLAFERCSEATRLASQSRAPCGGLTATELKCALPHCSYKKVRHDVISVIPLTIPKSLKGMKLRVETLLRDYFRIEVLRGASCDECKARDGTENTGLLKKTGFAKLPQCLIVRVERLGILPSGNVYKVSDHVDFAETLDVRDFCFYRGKQEDYDRSATESRTPQRASRIVGGASGRTLAAAAAALNDGSGMALPFRPLASIDGGSFVADSLEACRYRYQLRAVSVHVGHASSGHFVTYRRGLGANSHKWFLTDDTKVTRVPYQQVAASEAYMLYYERMRKHPVQASQ